MNGLVGQAAVIGFVSESIAAITAAVVIGGVTLDRLREHTRERRQRLIDAMRDYHTADNQLDNDDVDDLMDIADAVQDPVQPSPAVQSLAHCAEWSDIDDRMLAAYQDKQS